MSRRSRVTIRDVAARAGVSITAVSHALNDKGTLSQATRERVREVARDLGYQADNIARALRTSETGVIGLVLRPLDESGDYHPLWSGIYTEFSGAAALAAADLGLSLMLLPNLGSGRHSPLALSLDGYVVADPRPGDPVVQMLEGRGVPLVTAGSDSRGYGGPWVAADHAGNTSRMLDFLASTGAREIAFVASSEDTSWNDDGVDAYEKWCERRGIVPLTLRIPEASGEEGGFDLARREWSARQPDAVYCLSGRHATGIQRRLREIGVRIPEHVQIAAALDSEYTRSAGITTLDLHISEGAYAAVTLLAGMIGDGVTAPTAPVAPIEGSITARASTRAARMP